MPKVIFDHTDPLPGYNTAPVITAEQMSRFLYEAVGSGNAKTIAALLNKDFTAGYYGQLQTTYVPPVEAPKYLPINRKVRVKDLEPGCVLRFCGGPAFDYFVKEDGLLTIGKEYVVSRITISGFYIPYDKTSDVGVSEGCWTAGSPTCPLPFEFVSNPNYVHGFRIGETVYSTVGERFVSGPAEKPACSTKFVEMGDGYYLPSELTRDITKAAGYKPPEPTYPVRDGDVTLGDTVWWLDLAGPRQVAVKTDLYNLKRHPQFYQIAEPAYDLVTTVQGKLKAYRYMQAPFNGDSAAYYKSLKKPVFKPVSPKDWRVGDIVRYISDRDYQAVQGIPNECAIKEFRDNADLIAVVGSSRDNGHYASRFEWVRRP